jgi:ABC-type branched-subunit amino acid transport system substrate-binding protein
MRSNRKPRAAALALGVATTVVLAACSSGGSKAASGAAQSGGTGTSPATASPIEVGLPYVVQTTSSVPAPELALAATAASKWINDHGGIKGHRVVVDTCDDHFTATGSSTCVRGFADNKKVVAIVGGETCFSDASDAILKSSGLPWLAGAGCGANSYTGPEFTLTAGGVVGDARALGSLVAAQHLPAAIITFNLPQADVIVNGITDAAKAAGGSVVGTVRVDPSTTDMSAAVSTALQHHPQAIVPQTSTAQIASVVQALKQQGYTGKIVLAATQVPASTLASLGSATSQIVGATSEAPVMAPDADVPALKEFRADMAAVGGQEKDLTNAYPVWVAFHQFYDAASKAATLDRAGIMAAAKGLTDWTYNQSNPPLNFSAAGPFTGYPNIVMHWAALLTVANNKWVWDGKWVDAALGPQ